MRKLAFFCVAAAAATIIGCGGGGKSNSSSTTAGTSAGSGGLRAPAATVNLGTSVGLVYTGFMTGVGAQGAIPALGKAAKPALGKTRAQNDLYLNLTDYVLNDSFLGNSVHRAQSTPIRLHLGTYTFQFSTTDVPLTGLNSEAFDSVTLVPFSFATENADGSVALNPTDPGYVATDASTSQVNAFTRLRTFPGRDSVLPIFLDDSMFALDSSGAAIGLVIPDPADFPNLSQFAVVNQAVSADPTISGKVPGFISDMLQIDLSHIPAANVPTLIQSGLKASHFYLSGDAYAMSDDVNNQPGTFEELTIDPMHPIDGVLGQPGNVLSQQFQFGAFPGTYDLLQPNPSDLSGISKITSLFGRWRAMSTVLNMGSTTFDIIILPNSNETFSPTAPADVIGVVHNGTTVTNIYAGYATLAGATAGAGTVKLFPLPAFVKGQTTGELDYTLNGYTNATGVSTTDEPSVRNGNFAKAGTATLPAGFATSGTFVVFR